ncbi:MAG: DEAD/DEAH box helicase [Candidatus Verstraetearchaeota archaeon]|nr:DEAD/DEAH box helicase [Candidatus Verstraetearchaeota archaeon]
MGIQEEVLDSLFEMGYAEPTRIQSEVIPIIKQGVDVIGQSETGSGKTAAFGIPLVEKVSRGVPGQALVLLPTRELALQIADSLSKYSSRKGLRTVCVYGGASMGPQISGLRYAEMIVGTPGRVLDLIRQGHLKTGNVHTFVLDEADKMVDMGFIEDVEVIAEHLPEERQTLLFAATLPERLEEAISSFTSNPKRVRTETKVREDLLEQFYCEVDRKMRFSLLVRLLSQEKPKTAIIFCNSRREVEQVTRNLNKCGIAAVSIHGGLSQSRRESVISSFHRGRICVLVATDVAARGLDFKSVSHVFNYSLPRNTEDYVNRIGRTARAGESGKAISLLSGEDYGTFRRIVNLYEFSVQEIEYGELERLPFLTSPEESRDRRPGRYRREGDRWNDGDRGRVRRMGGFNGSRGSRCNAPGFSNCYQGYLHT